MPSGDHNDHKVLPRDVEKIQLHYADMLREAFGPSVDSTGDASGRTLTLRASITDINTSMAAVNGLTAVALGMGFDRGGVATEIDLIDPTTDDLVGQFVARSATSRFSPKDAFLSARRLGGAKLASRRQARALADALADAMAHAMAIARAPRLHTDTAASATTAPLATGRESR